MEAKLAQIQSNDDSVMSAKSGVSSSSRRRRRSATRRSFAADPSPASESNVIWVNGRPLSMPTPTTQNFTSPPQQATNINNPSQGYTGTSGDAINFSLPKHMQDVVNADVDMTPGELHQLAGDAPTPNKLRQSHNNPLLGHSRNMPRSGQGPAWAGPMGVASDADDPADIEPEAESIGSQSKANAGSESAVSAGLGAKLKAQLAALKAESEQGSKQELEMSSTSQSQRHSTDEAQPMHQGPFSSDLVSPPDSVQGEDQADTASDPGASLASEQAWTAGLGQDLGKQLQARLAKASKAPSGARPPVHRARPTSEQTWSAGQGASLGSQLKQQLAQLRSEGQSDQGAALAGAAEPQKPARAAPRDVNQFPAQPVRVPWTATVPESSEETWSDSVGRRVRQQLTNIRGLGNDVSVPPPRKEQRPSVFDLFSDQPMRSDRPTWSAGIGEKMRKQLEEMRKQDLEDSAHTASSSSQDQEPATRSLKKFATNSLPSSLPASEQTWTAGMGDAAKKELQNLQRRSIIQRNMGSPDIPDDYGRSYQSNSPVSQSVKDESKQGGREYLQQDSLAFHHLEEIPHVSCLSINAS